MGRTDRAEGLTGRDEPLGDRQSIDLLSRITTLAKVDPLDILLGNIVLSVGKRLNLVLHQVKNVEPVFLVR